MIKQTPDGRFRVDVREPNGTRCVRIFKTKGAARWFEALHRDRKHDKSRASACTCTCHNTKD